MIVERILAVDPGDVHCGWAILQYTAIGYHTNDTGVTDPDGIELQLAMEQYDVAVLEDFRNYPGRGTWSQNQTSQLLGSMKSSLREAGTPFFLQLPAIKKVARGHMRARGVGLVKPTTDSRLYGHAYDAQAHGWYWVFKHGGRSIGGPVITMEEIHG